MKLNFHQYCVQALLITGLAFGGASVSLAENGICELTYDPDTDPQAVGYCISYCEVSKCDALDGTESEEEAAACNALYDRIVEHTGAVPPC